MQKNFNIKECKKQGSSEWQVDLHFIESALKKINF